MSEYTNQTKVEAYLQRSLTAQELVMLPLHIKSASNKINTFLNREYYNIPPEPEDDEEPEQEAPEPTTRLFDGNGGREINISDAKEITKIEILDSQGGILLTLEPPETGVSQFITYPNNTEYAESIYLRSNVFPVGVARVRVTAVFGSGPVPDEVIAVATMLVGNLISNTALGVASTGDFDSESIEGYSYTRKSGVSARDVDTTTQTLLDSLGMYKKYTI